MNNEIELLEESIRRHNHKYYDEDSPEISDLEYDKLVKRLKELSPNSVVFSEIGHPVFGTKVQHDSVMGSLSKCHSAKEVLEKFRGQTVVVMPKIDGVSLSIKFNALRIQSASTRGDGTTGEDVTANAVMIKGIPERVPYDSFECRGEVYVALSDFFGKMDQPGYDGMPNGMANPRNAAAGSLRQKNPAITFQRGLKFVAYELLNTNKLQCLTAQGGNSIEKHNDKLDVLEKMGFEVPPYLVIKCDDEEIIQEAIDKMKSMEVSLPYETDGIVIRLASQDDFESLGFSGKCPKGALAYKFESVKAKSRIIDIEWTTSRTGRVVPVAIIEPTRISGSVVSRITLNNLAWIENVDVAIGDEILFCKANEIIPQLVSVINRNPIRDIQKPLACPSCSESLARPNSSDGSQGIDICCMNDSCPAQFKASVLHILEKLDIKGIAESIIDKVVEAGLVKHPYEILDLKESSLKAIGFGERQSEVICNAIKTPEASKAHILSCLGIDGWGRRMFETLSKQISLDDIAANAVSIERLASTPGVGLIRAKALVDGLTAKEDLLNGLMKRIAVKKEAPRGTSLAGKSFLVTGTLSVKRQEIEKMIIDAGGDVISGVSKKLNYLIVGEDAGSKLDKAVKLGIPTITEDQFRAMLP